MSPSQPCNPALCTALNLEGVFEQFATFGHSAALRTSGSGSSHEMDNRNFVKLLRVRRGRREGGRAGRLGRAERTSRSPQCF